MTKDELKKKVCAAIDARGQELIAFGEDVLAHPELGYKEVRTSAKAEEKFKAIGMPYERGIAITGLKGRLKGKSSDITVGVMGELDSVLCPGHPFADKVTGGAHCCGHNGQLTAMIGAGMGLNDAGAMQYLGGDVALIAMPAEECVEIEWRQKLRDEGRIQFIGGKQQFVVEGAFDDVDMVTLLHAQTDPGYKMGVGGTMNGFIAKYVRFRGKEAHAGGAPHLGVNALNAAMLGLMNIHAQRETFKDEDSVRIHPIINKGGDLVNVIPADVRMEMLVRARSTPAVLDACMKVDRALRAGAMAVGAEVEITNVPGYLPRIASSEFDEVVAGAVSWLVGPESLRYNKHTTASNDIGDLSHLMPTGQFGIGGVRGIGHSEDYTIVDKELFYLGAAKEFAVLVIDLLWDDASVAKRVKAAYKAPHTKETYLKAWEELLK